VYELFLLLATCAATLAERDGYTVCYDTQNQRPLWTIHQPRHSDAPTPRKHWRKDHLLNSLPTAAFTNSGFDRGHLATAADLPESQDTFLTSNAVPQIPSLNRGQWRALENKIRKLRPTRILTGAVYANCGNAQLEAPCFLYKLVILEDGRILADYAKNAPPRP
jgi:endonuclease G